MTARNRILFLAAAALISCAAASPISDAVKEKKMNRNEPDIGPETCGQDRQVLSTWFREHGSSSLILDPRPPLVEVVEENPYLDPSNPPLQPDELSGYCGMQWDFDSTDPATGNYRYRLKNFTERTDAEAEGYNITHCGHCGACSSLQDLGVYMGKNLTAPVRFCSTLGIFNATWEYECMKFLGFSDECVSIWIWNVHNTREKCFWRCLYAWVNDIPNVLPDGSLNACMLCDEDISGPNFKYFSGRTRRTSGIPSAIPRPPEEMCDVEHCYFYDLLSQSALR